MEYSQFDKIKMELGLLKKLRVLIKAYTRVGPSDAGDLAQIWDWLGIMISNSEAYMAEVKKEAKTDEVAK